MRPNKQARGGSALIIVLGFLSILLLIVFAFAVKMQTEYRVARSAEANVRTEFIMVQGIHLTALEVGHPVSRPGLLDSPVSPWYYPRREVFDSEGILVGDLSRGLITNYLASPADLFVPLAVSNAAMVVAQTNYFGILPRYFGGPVRDVNSTCGEQWRCVATDFEPSGVAYCVLNNSGYLDINAPYGTAAGANPRGYGTNISEIKLDGVITATWQDLEKGRQKYGRIESTMELYAYGNESASFNLSSNDLAMFGPYSHCPLGQYWSTNTETLVNAVVLTGNVDSVVANSTDVLDAFNRSGFNQPITIGASVVTPLAVRGWLFTNLLEYMDDTANYGEPPRGFSQPCQEAIPGINEIGVDSLFRCTRTPPAAPINYQYNLTVKINIEVWRPHVMPTPVSQDYCIYIPKYKVVVTPVSGAPIPAFSNTTACTMFGTVDSRTPLTMTGNLIFFAPVTNSASYTDNCVFNLRFDDGLKLRLGSDIDGDVVDWVIGPITIVITNSVSAEPNLSQTTDNTGRDRLLSMECIDPRFNWDFTNMPFWIRGTNTLGRTNDATFAYLTNSLNNTDYAPGDDLDKATYAFSSDSPLRTVGELGYLVVAPWRTIRLTKGIYPNQNVEPVVDTFSLKPPGTVERGLINPNTCFTGVLQAAFNGAYMDLYPGEPLITAGGTCSNLSSGHAAMLATAMLMYTYKTDSTASAANSTNGLLCGLLNVSQLGEVTNIFHNAWLTNNLGADCEFRREAIVRNSVGLFSTRNVLYTTVLIASDEIDGGGGTDFPIRNTSRMGAEHLAVATIVRDPWSKELFIRHFRYLPSDGVLKNY